MRSRVCRRDLSGSRILSIQRAYGGVAYRTNGSMARASTPTNSAYAENVPSSFLERHQSMDSFHEPCMDSDIMP